MSIMKEVYAVRNNLNEVMKSSSGGAFIAICKALESKYGRGNVTFYGVCFDNKMNVIHKRVNYADECSIFQGSKYVKSDINNCFELVRQDLLKGKIVLFSGTPCQVCSVKAYIKNKNTSTDNLFTIDIICHGTPKEKIWKDYIEWLEKKQKSKLIKYSFRYKPEGWKAYPAFAQFENGEKLVNTAETSVFSKLHMKRYSINKGCFSCKFSNMDRTGDITIGDYWGIEKINPKIYDKNGVSLVIVNTRAGQEVIKIIQEDKNVIVVRTIENQYLKYQHNLNKPTEKPEEYEKFWEEYEKNGIDYVIKKYLNYNSKYKLCFRIKKAIRKTPIIGLYRKLKLER